MSHENPSYANDLHDVLFTNNRDPESQLQL